jgi:uncharacterized membrane protein YccC
MEISEWNWSAERRTAIGDVANQSLEYVAERLLESRKRAFEAERTAQSLQTKLDSLKAAHAWIKTSERLPNKGETVLAKVSGDRESTLMILVYMPSHNEDPMPWRLYGMYAWLNSAFVLTWAPIPSEAE